MALAKAIFFPQGKMLADFENRYAALTSRCVWEAPCSPEAMREAVNAITLDNAYAGMRRLFFKAEAHRQTGRLR